MIEHQKDRMAGRKGLAVLETQLIIQNKVDNVHERLEQYNRTVFPTFKK